MKKGIARNTTTPTILFLLFVTLLFATSVFALDVDVTGSGSSGTVNGALIDQITTGGAGSGTFDPFVRIQAHGNATTETGYNTEANPHPADTPDTDDPFTSALLLSGVPEVNIGGVLYRQFTLDVNESGGGDLPIDLTVLQIFTANSGVLSGYNATPPSIGGATTLVWDLDQGGDNTILLKDQSGGSGNTDYVFHFPSALFGGGPNCAYGGAGCTKYVYFYTTFEDVSNGFEEWAVFTGTSVLPTIEVIKDIVPDSDTGLFDLQVNGTTVFDDAGDGHSSGPVVVDPGTHTVGELAGTGTVLSDYTTAIVCRDEAGITVASGTNAGPLNVPVDEEDHIVCTITNTRKHRDLRISISPLTDTNAVGDMHTFTVTIEQSTTAGVWVAVPDGTKPTITVTPNTYLPAGGTCATTGTVAGACTYGINSIVAGTYTATAEVTVVVDGVSITRSTNNDPANIAAGGTGNATKNYSHLRISITPTADTNAAGDPHTFTVTVEQSTAYDDWDPVPNGTKPTITITPNTYTPVSDTCATTGTTAGECMVTINSDVPGIYTASGEVTVVVNGVSITRKTVNDAANIAAGGTGNATKTYVDLRISITPNQAANAVGDPHTFTIKVEKNLGDGAGWSPVQSANPVVTVSPLPDSLTDNCDLPDGTNANGECTVVINSDDAGIFTATAEVTVTVAGVSITRATGTAANGNAFDNPAQGANATKTYVNLRISINPESDTNVAGDPHTFTIKVEQNDGNGWTAVAGVNPTVSISPAPTSQTNNCDAPDATNASGECTFVINNNTAGFFTVTAGITHSVSGVSITRSTHNDPLNLAAGGTGNAVKTYIVVIDDYRIKIDPLDATNAVGEAHVFTVTVEHNDGSGWMPVSGVNPTVSFNPNVPAIDNTCDDVGGTNANGQCTVTISTEPQTIEAEASVVINGKTYTTGTQENIDLGGSDNAFKTFVNLRISISPTSATNVAGDAHTFTILVEQHLGANLGSWEPLAGAFPVVNVYPVPDSLTDSCSAFGTNANGECQVQINSATPGVFTASATVTASVGGRSITRRTWIDPMNMSAGGSLNATKEYVDLRISISPLDATNNLHDPHTFTILVERNDSSGWTPVSGAFPAVSFNPVIAPVSDTCAAPGTDANGECQVTINSAVPNTYIASAEVTVNVGGISITRETGTAENTAAGGSGDATKTYEDVYIILTPSYLVTRVIEGVLTGDGSIACYWLTLSNPPVGDVVIDVDPGNLLSEVTVNKSQITLNTSNWNNLTLTNQSNFLCVRAVDDTIDESENVQCGDKSADMTSDVQPYSQECGDHKEFVEHTVNQATTDPAYTTNTPWINHTLTYLGRPANNYLEVLVLDDDDAAVILTESFAVTDLDEIGTPVGKACYWVTLSSMPANSVTVNINPDNTQVMTNKSFVVLNASNWNTIDPTFNNQTNFVCVSPINDDIVDPPNPKCFTGAASMLGVAGTGPMRCGTHLGFIAHSAVSADPKYNATSNFIGNGANFDNNPSTIDAMVRNDDVAGVNSKPATVNLIEGQQGTFALGLSSRPEAAVEVTGDNFKFTFQPSNWNIPQPVTIQTQQNDTAGPPLTLLYHLNLKSADPNFNNLAVPPVEVTVIDDDSAGVFLSTTSIQVSEWGQTDTYNLVLTSRPSGNVTVTLDGGGQLDFQPASVTFTTTNWNVPKSVKVSAVNDQIAEGAFHTARITHNVTSADSDYAGLMVAEISAVIADDDTAEVLLQNANGLAVSENGQQKASYQLMLRSKPTAVVEVEIDGGGRVAASPAKVTFTPQNWNQAQTVQLIAIDNAVDQGQVYSASVTHKAHSADLFYDGFEPQWLEVTVSDDDIAGLKLSKAVINAGNSTPAAYTVALTSRPVTNVLIDLVLIGDGTASAAGCVNGEGESSCLLFTPANWNQPQTVTVTANGKARIEHLISGGDGIYNSLGIQYVLVNDMYTLFMPVNSRD